MAIGQKIQTLRRKSNLSEEKLAEQLGVSRQAISKWELGESVPDTDKVIQLSRAFDVPTDYLLFDDMTGGKDVAIAKVEEPTNKRTDTTVPFIGAIGVSLIGLLISIAAYFTWQTVFTVCVGLIVQITAIFFFEAMVADNNNNKSRVRRRFYSISLWLILPFPVFYSFQFAFRFYPYPRLYLVDLLCTAIGYLLLCGIITLILRKVRTN